MSTWMLEAYDTSFRGEDGVRHRSYTRSRRKAGAFAAIPRIQFTDSGHGIVFYAEEHRLGSRRLPARRGLEDYIRKHTS